MLVVSSHDIAIMSETCSFDDAGNAGSSLRQIISFLMSAVCVAQRMLLKTTKNHCISSSFDGTNFVKFLL